MNDTNKINDIRHMSNFLRVLKEISDKDELQGHEFGIYIFGTGKGGQAVLKCLTRDTFCDSLRYRVKGFFDNSTAKHGTSIDGIPIFIPRKDIISEVDFIIIASFIYCYDMEIQLLEMGVDEHKIILPGSWLSEILPADQQVNSSCLSTTNKASFELYERYIDYLFKQVGSKSDEFIDNDENFQVHLQEDDVKLIAFYLPQFHPVPENDRWWGRGFTEWTNVTKAVPQYLGHHQPQLPIDVGFYDLRNIKIMERQIELARKYGIGGFCFYHYWFDSKRLLETPVNNFLAHKELNMPFCLCWANENWTRRWDGMDNEILIAQKHSTDDDLSFIADISRYFNDSRYIKIGGKPLFILYRPLLLPDIKGTITCWRDYCRREGIGEIFIAGVKAFAFSNPQVYGFDAVVEFPPNNCFSLDITNRIPLINPNFTGRIYDYTSCVERSHYVKRNSFVTFRGVMPGWDNTARKPNNPTIFYGSNPKIYQKWLENAIWFTKKNSSSEHQIVFINAWNEWAEGAHLEPDRKYGYGNLQATANAIINSRESKE